MMVIHQAVVIIVQLFLMVVAVSSKPSKCGVCVYVCVCVHVYVCMCVGACVLVYVSVYIHSGIMF